MARSFTNPNTPPPDLIAILKQRGLCFSDEALAENYLWNIGYFRLSAYLHPLVAEPKSDKIFKPDATFDKALAMYRFDRKLRLVLFNEIEKIEVAIRSMMVNIMAEGTGDVFWITNSSYFHSQTQFSKSLAVIDTEIERSKEEFILDFKRNFTDPYPPAWMIAEILPLGSLCAIFRNIKIFALRKRIAGFFGLNIPSFDSWTQVIGLIRNICCHHARLWNKIMVVTPAIPSRMQYPWIDINKTDPKRVYLRICMIKYMLIPVSPLNSFTDKIKELLNTYPTIDKCAMGFPEDWESEPLWC